MQCNNETLHQTFKVSDFTQLIS